MLITLKDGYVHSYCIVGELVDSIEVSEPTDMSHFESHSSAYKLVDGELIFDNAKGEVIELERTKDELRRRREKECFAVVDRSQFWYDNLTEEQKTELKEWYNAWLIVTNTLIVPDKPDWLD